MNFDYSSHLTAVVAAHALESAPGGGSPAHPNCLDCGAALTDRFCAHCGQPADTHRITLKHLILHDLPHSVWHVDKGLLYTLGQLLRRPGVMLREYFAGRRTRHFRPITFLLLIVGITVLLTSAIGLQSAAMSPPGAPRFLALAQERYMKFLFKAPSLVYVVLIPLNAVWANWLARRAKFNYAEHLLGQAFIIGAATVISLFTTLPLMMLARNSPSASLVAMLSFVPSLLYSAWAYAQLLDQTNLPAAGRWLRGAGIAVLQTLTLSVAFLALMGYFVFAVLRENPALMKELTTKKPAAAQTAPATGRR